MTERSGPAKRSGRYRFPRAVLPTPWTRATKKRYAPSASESAERSWYVVDWLRQVNGQTAREVGRTALHAPDFAVEG